ncbi:MAG: baseplate J/gp47 family protein [Ruminococcus sp.]|nr:baseplate J/gp47 family protein [Ruminococcus sp.]
MDNYENILARMKDRYMQISGYPVPELSDIDIRMKVLAGEIYQNEVNLDFVKRQISPLTATGQYLDRHASDRGLTRFPAIAASGMVKFFGVDGGSRPLTIPQGTVVSTSGVNGVRYTTTEEVVMASGTNEISAPCVASQAGVLGNTGTGKVNVLVTSIVGIVMVRNYYPMRGGCDAETDESLRKRILDAHKYISNGANAAYYKQLALSVEGITSANVLELAGGAGTVDVYVASGRAAPDTAKVNQVRNLLLANRCVDADLSVFPADPKSFTIGIFATVKDGYYHSDVQQGITDSINEMLISRGVGESVYEYHIGSAVINTEGVESFEWLNGYDNRCVVNPEEFANISNLHIDSLVNNT